MKRVTLNFPIRVGGLPRQAGETVDLADSDYQALRHRRRGGRPLFDPPAGSKTASPEKRSTTRTARRLERAPAFDKSAPYVRAPEGTQELERGSRAVLAWEGNTAIQFRCPCDARLVYITSPPHTISFDADGVLELVGSCGYNENAEKGRPKNWCHFSVHGKKGIEIHDDSQCPGNDPCPDGMDPLSHTTGNTHGFGLSLVDDLDAEFLGAPARGDDGRVRWATVERIEDAVGVSFLEPVTYWRNGGRHGTPRVTLWSPKAPTDIPLTGPGRWNLVGTGLADLSLVAGSSSVMSHGGGDRKFVHSHYFVTSGRIARSKLA